MHSKPLLARVVFAAVLLGALDPRPLLRIRSEPPADLLPEYVRFLAEVKARSAPGQSIAVAAPARSWSRGYSSIYYRASYILAGRRVIPLIDRDDSFHFERLGEVELVAVWGMGGPRGRYALLWSGHHGALYRRLP